MGAPEGAEIEGAQGELKERMAENFSNVMKYMNTGRSTNSNKVNSKRPPGTCYNQIFERQRQRKERNLEISKREETHHI